MPIRKRFQKVYEEGVHPSHSPWGQPQTWIMRGPGIWIVTTASHGGFWLTEQRNADMPSYFRNKDGWYEEDLEYAKVVCMWPEVWADKPETVEHAKKSVLNWYPDAYEKHYKVTIPAGESMKRGEAEWRAQNIGRYVARTAWGPSFHGVPSGMVVVEALLGDDTQLNERKAFLVPQEDYKNPDKGWTKYGFAFQPGHQYEEVDLKKFDPYNTKRQAANPEVTLADMATTKTVKVELILTYDTNGPDGEARPEPKRWDWNELLDLAANESVQVVDQKDIF